MDPVSSPSLLQVLLIVLVPLAVVGGMAATLFGFIYGIVKRRPGVIAASVAVPFLLLVAGIMSVGAARYMSVAQFQQTPTVWTPTVEMPPMPPMPSMPAPLAMNLPSMEFQSRLALAKIAIIVLIIAVIIHCIRKATGHAGDRSGGWLKTLCVGAIVVLALNFFFVRVQYERNQATVSQARAEATLQRDLAVARQNDVVARHDQAMDRQLEVQARQYAEAAEKMAKELEGTQTMQQLWDKVTQPRIQLNEVSKTATVESPGTKATQAVVLDAVKTPESIENSLARLERMVAQVSAVADQVSDTGTLIGKAMIAINETIDSRARTAGNLPKTTADIAIEKFEVVGHSSDKTMPVLAEANIPARRTVEIVFDAGRLSQYAMSFEKIKAILGRDGLWHGTTVRFVPQEGRIVISGDLDDDYAARLSGTLVNTVGKHRTPIHLSDVATITSEHGEMSGDVAGWTRPAWVDEPPKRIGNVRREVVETEEYATTDECARAADVYLLLKTYEYFQQLLGMPHGDNALPSLTFRAQDHAIMTTDGQVIYQQWGHSGLWRDSRVLALQAMGVDLDFIRREIVPANREYYETVERSFGPMKKLYTQVEFTPSIDAELRRRWDEVRRQDRFAAVGAGAGSVLGLIGLAFGLLRVDTWTKGYYTKRLFLGVPAAIIMGALLLWTDPMHLF